MDYKYKAFISYRHLEPDMQAAEKLQKLLEAYKPPKNLGKTKENWRIFRDVSELQSSSDLSEDIVNAIENSEFLIVICSPKYTESKWCMQELTRFRELHDNTNKNIITLLVSGEPHESFPEELTYTEMTTTNENGEEVKVKVEVEPLAANIKAESLKESMKKLNTEYLRIAAPLLGCDFNDLYQRERRREAARRRRIFGVVSGVLSLITVISVASAVTINGKNVEINKQNTQIKEQNAQIEQKNKDLLIENAGHLASESENLFKESNLVAAVQKAVEALPSDGEDKPVIPEAEYVLSRELGVFRHKQIMPRLALKHECTVEKLSFMGGGKTIVSQDATGVYFWNPETGELIKKIAVDDGEFGSSTNSSSNKYTVYFDTEGDTSGTRYEYAGAPSSTTSESSPVFNRIYAGFEHVPSDDEPGTGGDVYLYNSDNTLWRIDGATGEVKWKADPAENAYEYKDTVFDEKYVIRLYRNKTVMANGVEFVGNESYAELIDRETGKVEDTVKITATSGESFGFIFSNDILAVRDGKMYIYSDEDGMLKVYEIKDHALVSVNEFKAEGVSDGGINRVDMKFVKDEPVVASCSIMAYQTETLFMCYDKDMKTQKWRTAVPVNYDATGKMYLMPASDTGYAHDVLAVSTKLSLSFIDYETGALIKSIKYDCESTYTSFSKRGFAQIILESGEEYLVALGNYTSGDSSTDAVYRVQDLESSVLLSSYSRCKYVTAGDYSNTAYIRYAGQNPDYTDIDPGEYMYSKKVLAVDETGTYSVIASTYYPDGKYNSTVNHLFIYTTSQNGEVSGTEVKELEGYDINSAGFAGKEKVIVSAVPKSSASSDDEFYSIDVKTGKVEKIADALSSGGSKVKFVPSGNGVFYLSDTRRNITYINAEGKVTSWEKKKEGAVVPERKVIEDKYAVCDTRAAFLAEENSEGEKAIEVFSFDSEKSVRLKIDLSSDEGLAVQRIFWQNSNTVGVFLNNRTVSFFDAESGEAGATVSLVGTSQEPVSVVPVSDDNFAVLCRDSHIYEMNTDGFTGRSCRLEFTDEINNNIREYDSSNAGKLEVMNSSESFRKYVVWDEDEAWLLDTDHFAVRYRIDDFAAAGGEYVFISDKINNKAGFFPVYSTDRLLGTADNFLSALD